MEETQTGGEQTSLVPNEIESRLQGLTDEELFAVASRARKIAYGRRDPQRKEGAEGRRWLVAHRTNCHRCPRCRPSKEAKDRGEGELEMIHGPYWYLESYVPYAVTATEKSGKKRSGGSKNLYIGRYLPAELAEEFELEGGITPEQAGYAE